MIDLYFQDLNNQICIFRIEGTKLTIAVEYMGLQTFVPVDKLAFRKEGILKSNPDLKDKDEIEMKQIAIQRLKDKISQLGGENFIKHYIIEELTIQGYKYKGFKQPGFRKING